MLNGGSVSCYSKTQPTVALSSTEAEYNALTLAAKETTWLRLLLTELGLLQIEQQHTLIKVPKGNTCAKAIQDGLDNACRGLRRAKHCYFSEK